MDGWMMHRSLMFGYTYRVADNGDDVDVDGDDDNGKEATHG
jgi:hypothetical protein